MQSAGIEMKIKESGALKKFQPKNHQETFKQYI